MRLERLVIKNLRSYEEEEIVFPKGATLLSGDIGSGKTTILLAVEFALFGLQPGQRGSSLLRNGVEEGGVTLQCEIEGREVVIERTLKRGKTVSQDYAAITIDGEKDELSVMELKSKVLQLLNYPTEFAKKQNILYKFTVYTPQEEMKQIILEDAATRLNTLRHIFGVDKYRQILDNTAIVLQKLREEKRLKEALSSGIGEEKERLLGEELRLEERKTLQEPYKKELAQIQEKLEEKTKELLALEGKKEERRKLEAEIEKTKVLLAGKEETLVSNKKITDTLTEQLDALASVSATREEEESLREMIAKRRSLLEENEAKIIEKQTRLQTLELKNKESEELSVKIEDLEICPTCLQDVPKVYKSNVRHKAESDIAQNVREMETLLLEKRKLDEEKNTLLFEKEQAEQKLQELLLNKGKIEGKKEKELRKEELLRANEQIEKDKDMLQKHIFSLKETILSLSNVGLQYDEKKQEQGELLREERRVEIQTAELNKEIDVTENQIADRKERIKKLDAIKEEFIHLQGLEAWFVQRFIPIISHIEKNVMLRLKAEFSSLLQEWFSMLVPEAFTVRLADDFSPLIEHQDYEIDYAYLSGGERTAIALAYRLALNQVINEMMSKIKTRDIVILDEPTDGFSEHQLDKMREVLDELNVEQLLIVSHEQKIEGFVENVIKIRKEHGLSRIEAQL